MSYDHSQQQQQAHQQQQQHQEQHVFSDHGASVAVPFSPLPASVEAALNTQATTVHSPLLPKHQRLRRPSKGKSPSELKRSVSTPHMRNLSSADSGAVSPTADKRRNKLGYHRTSVACGHCRKRKIRCLVNDNDPGGKCQNCIRLKKECHFFAVEQAPPDQRPSSSSKKETKVTPPSATAPPSPRSVFVPVNAQVQDYNQFGDPLPDQSGPQYGNPADIDVLPPDAHSVPLMSATAYPQTTSGYWSPSGYISQSTSFDDPNIPASYYSSPQPSVSSTLDSGIGFQSMPISRNFSDASSLSFGAYEDDQAYRQPPRSLSHGSIANGTQMPGFVQHQVPITPNFQQPTASYTFAHQMNAAPHILPSSTQAGSFTAPASTAPVDGFTYPQGVASYGFTGGGDPTEQVPSQPFGRQWYQDPMPLERLDEEQPQILQTQFHNYYAPNPGPT